MKTTSTTKTKESVIKLINEAVKKRVTVNKLSLQKKVARNKVANYIYKLDGMIERKTITKKDAVEVKRAYKVYFKLAPTFIK